MKADLPGTDEEKDFEGKHPVMGEMAKILNTEATAVISNRALLFRGHREDLTVFDPSVKRT